MSKLNYTCGTIYPSGCVIFTGDLPTFIPEADVPCDANLDIILSKINDKVQKLLDSNDFTQLTKGNQEFNPATVTAKQLHQIEIDALAALDTRLFSLETDFNTLDIGEQLVSVDLKCLTTAGNPCQVSPNIYTLTSIINILVNEICLLKSQINP